MFKRLSTRLPRLYHPELLQSHQPHRILYQPSHPIVTLLHQQINNDIENHRRHQQFEHIIEQKRDWMSYLVLQINFKKNTTMVTLRSYDRVLFGVKCIHTIHQHQPIISGIFCIEYPYHHLDHHG